MPAPPSRTLAIAVLVGITLLSLPGLMRLHFAYDIDRFFPQDDPAVEAYARHKALFGEDIDVLLIGLELPHALDDALLLRIRRLTDTLIQRPYAAQVRSLTTLAEPVRLPLGEWVSVPYFAEQGNARDGLPRLFHRTELRPLFLSNDTAATTVVLHLKPEHDPTARASTLRDVNALAASTGLPYHLAGRLATQAHYLQATRTQLGLLGGLALLLMVAVLFITFRYPLLSLAPLFVSVLALLWVLGGMGWMNVAIEPLLSLLPAILLVLGTAFSIHIVSWFRELAKSGMEQQEAMREAIAHTRSANALSAFSTALGFSSLALYPVLPLRAFGLAAAAGIVVALMAAWLLLPVLAPWMNVPRRSSSAANPTRSFTPILQRRSLTVFLSALLIAGGLLSAFHLRVENHFLDDLDSESTLGRSATFFEERFSGTRPLELAVHAVDGDLLDPAALTAMDTLTGALQASFDIARPMGPPGLVRAVMRGAHLEDAFPMGARDQRLVRQALRRLEHSGQGIRMLDSSNTIGRITGRIPDVGSIRFAEALAALEPLLNNAHIRTTITGGAWLMDLANRRIATVLVWGILGAILLNALILAIVLRSVRMALISILPNLVPLAAAALLMVLFDIPLKVSTAMIFPVLYGIALDDTMHVLLLHQRLRKEGRTAAEASALGWNMLRAPLRHTTLVLSAGFALLGLSAFAGIAAFGLIAAVGMWVAWAADRWLLPALLYGPGPLVELPQAPSRPA